MVIWWSMNSWSCSVQAAAKVMCIPTQQLVDEIGHDGGAIKFPDLPKPMCYAGFHNQEIQDAALRLGWAMMTLELVPQATPDRVHIRNVFTEAQLKDRFFWYRFSYNGIASGQRHGKPQWHYNVWLSWDKCVNGDDPGGQWFDAGGRELETPNIQIAYFFAFIKLPTNLRFSKG